MTTQIWVSSTWTPAPLVFLLGRANSIAGDSSEKTEVGEIN
jgi:hypothetical protein